MITDYEYYLEQYCGDKIDNSLEFKRKARDAENIIRRYTLGRIDRVEDESLLEMIKYTTCKLIDLSAEHDEFGSHGSIKSEKVGGYSVTYGDAYDEEYSKVKEQEVYSVIRDNLIQTGLMYRGV